MADSDVKPEYGNLSKPMAVPVEQYSPSERAKAKARSRAEDEEALRSGKVSAAELARINGGGHVARGTVVLDSPLKAKKLLNALAKQERR